MAEWKDWNTPDTTAALEWSAEEGRSCGSSEYRRKSLFWKNKRSWQEGRGRKNNEEEGTKKKTWLKVSAGKVGRVIGKQGARIRELQSATGTYISVGRERSEGKVEISISGPAEAQERCREMILQLTEDQLFDPLKRQEDMGNIRKEEDNFCYIDWDAVNKVADECEKRRWSNLMPLKKDFYVEASEVALMSEEYVKDLRKSFNNIMANQPFGGTRKIPNPVETFEQVFGCYPELLDQLNKQKFAKPFPIQSQAWPILLSGHDMIGIAQTGTGKTLAFLIPALIHVHGQDTPMMERGGPNVLILAPTRELALQIDGEAKRFQYHGIRSACLYGGGERGEQLRELEKGVQIVIATPGRLNDMVAAGALNVDSVTFLVLDEADRMLDMGFERQIRRILLSLRPDRQTVMTSATWPYLIQNLAEKYMSEPIKVVVGSTDLTAVHSVKQTVYILNEEEKLEYLFDVISNLSPSDKIIIFVGKRAVADSLACDLILNKIECQSIHGSREQSDREQAIEDLKTGAVRILVATDVASRGIDIVDVTKVVNYDFPRNIEEYVHRVGRTGRAGKTGEAISFFTKYDQGHAKELIYILEEADQDVPGELREMSEAFEMQQERMRSEKFPGRGGRSYGVRRSYANE